MTRRSFCVAAVAALLAGPKAIAGLFRRKQEYIIGVDMGTTGGSAVVTYWSAQDGSSEVRRIHIPRPIISQWVTK